jgi:hypothetical protein
MIEVIPLMPTHVMRNGYRANPATLAKNALFRIGMENSDGQYIAKPSTQAEFYDHEKTLQSRLNADGTFTTRKLDLSDKESDAFLKWVRTSKRFTKIGVQLYKQEPQPGQS